MKNKPLGRTGVAVSELCFGTMSFGGDADEATSAAMYKATPTRASTSTIARTSTTRANPKRSRALIKATARTCHHTKCYNPVSEESTLGTSRRT